MDNYREEIAKIEEQLKEKTLGELQAEMKTSKLNYDGTGFGYPIRGKLPQTMEEAEEFLRPAGFKKQVEMLEAL
jgi:hypothetical protein